ncbi:hypothetical protein D3C72_2486700 [compost metagenome]
MTECACYCAKPHKTTVDTKCSVYRQGDGGENQASDSSWPQSEGHHVNSVGDSKTRKWIAKAEENSRTQNQ